LQPVGAGVTSVHQQDGEARTARRRGLSPGLAAEDWVALSLEGRELAEVVSAREGARAYRVTPGAEETLEPR